MRVILAHNLFRVLGGAENYYQNIWQLLKKNGHEVKIFSTDHPIKGSVQKYEVNDEVVLGKFNDYREANALKKISLLPEIIYSKPNKKIFKDLIKNFNPDVIHVFGIYVTLTPSILDAAREMNVPVVMSCNDYKHICPNYRLYHHNKVCYDCKGGKFYNAIKNNCCKHSIAVSIASSIEAYTHERMNIYRKNIHTFLFESQFMMNITKDFWGENTHHSRFLGKPFHAADFEYSPQCDDYLLYLGRLSDEKGVDILIKAMKLVPKAKLKIVGTGNFEEALKKITSELEVNNVEFVGHLFGDELKSVLQKSKFVVIPSLWHENFPYVQTEALSSGKAVVGSNKGGIPEYILNNRTGLVYESHNHKQLAEHIDYLWSYPEQTIEMGKQAKAYADKEFNIHTFYERLLNIYEEAVNSKNTEDILNSNSN